MNPGGIVAQIDPGRQLRASANAAATLLQNVHPFLLDEFREVPHPDE